MINSTLKRISFLLLFVCAALTGFAQGQADYWYFGEKVGIHFTGGSAVVLTDGATQTASGEGEGYATVSDASGNLLFYTDGVSAWTNTHTLMPSSATNMFGHISAAQSAVSVPIPNSPLATTPGGTAATYPRYHYIFTVPSEELASGSTGSKDPQNGLRVSVVDMNANGGYGNVVSLNTRLTPAGVPVMEAQTLVPTSTNSTDGTYWIICHGAGDRSVNNGTGAYSDAYYVYKTPVWNTNVATTLAGFTSAAGSPFSPAGSYAVPGSVTVDGSGTTIRSSRSQGIMKSNSCFTRLAISFYGQGGTNGRVQVVNFSNATGAVGAMTHDITNFDNRNEPYGVEWSPNGNYLFVSELTSNKISQFSLFPAANVNTAGARYTVASVASVDGGGVVNRTASIQLGPDGNMYVAKHNNWGSNGTPASYIGKIDAPDVFGAPAYNPTFLAYPGWAGWVSHGLPQFPKNFVAASVGISRPPAGTCAGTNNVTHTFTFSGTVSTYAWDFTNDGTPDNTTNNPVTTTYNPSSTTLYTAKISVTDVCGYTYSDTVKFLVYPQTNAAGTLTCPNTGSVTSPVGGYTYVWYSDAAGTKVIGTGTNPTLPIGVSGNVYVKAQDGATSSSSGSTLVNTSTNYSGNVSGNTVTANFTVSNPITLNSFIWYPQQTWGGTGTDTRSATVKIVDQATGTITYWTNTRSVTFGNTPASITESPAIILPSGNYAIKWTTASGTGVISSLNASSPASDANVSIASPSYVGYFNYTTTTYSVTSKPCSNLSAAIPYNCPLPVTWLSFTGKHVSGGNNLTWATAAETGSSYFDVERSTDGINFEYTGRVNAAGNTSRVTTYTYDDATDFNGVVYYRLRQVDIDGKVNFSSTIAISSNGQNSYSLLPNPGNGVVYLTGGGEEAVLVNVLDIQGRIVQANVSARAGSSLDLSGLPKGVYLVQIVSTGEVQTLRYVLQ